MPCWQQDSLLSTGPGIYPQVYHRGAWLFQISQKERLFHLLYQPSPIGDNLTVWSPFLHPCKMAFLSPSVWARSEYIWKLNWEESLLICFENCYGVPCSNRQSRNRMMKTFIIVNVKPICKRVSCTKSVPCPLRNKFYKILYKIIGKIVSLNKFYRSYSWCPFFTSYFHVLRFYSVS